MLPHAWSVINKSLFIVSKCMNSEEKLMCTQLISFIPILKYMFFFCHGTPKTSTKKKLLLRIFTNSTTTCILKWLGRVHRSRIFIHDARHYIAVTSLQWHKISRKYFMFTRRGTNQETSLNSMSYTSPKWLTRDSWYSLVLTRFKWNARIIFPVIF